MNIWHVYISSLHDVVELVGEGSVINGAYLSSYHTLENWIQCKIDGAQMVKGPPLVETWDMGKNTVSVLAHLFSLPLRGYLW